MPGIRCELKAIPTDCWSSWTGALFARHSSCWGGWLNGVRSLVRQILDGGHEIGSHGYGHQMIGRGRRTKTFRRDVGRAKSILEDQTGTKIKGYRAPSYSITSKTLWALEVLVELGFEYDSSIFPVQS